MSLFKFDDGDILHNVVKTYPQFDVFLYQGNFHFFSIGKVNETPINPHGLSANPYPFIIKANNLISFKTISSQTFHEDFGYGETLTGAVYPHSATIRSEYYTLASNRPKIGSLQNIFDFNQRLSVHFGYNHSTFGNKGTQIARLITFPALYYGSAIKKGSVSLKFYITGTLAGELVDDKQNGELRQLSPASNSGSVAGVVLYNEGCVFLTGTWAINGAHTETYDAGSVNPRWVDFAFTGTTAMSSTFSFHFSGTQKVPVLTMRCFAPKGELNFSNNPTFVQFNQSSSLTPLTGSKEFKENTNVALKNIKQTNFIEPTGSFEKITFISKVKVYDKDKNVIAIAQLAQPLRKREKDDFVIVLKKDL